MRIANRESCIQIDAQYPLAVLENLSGHNILGETLAIRSKIKWMYKSSRILFLLNMNIRDIKSFITPNRARLCCAPTERLVVVSFESG